MSAARAESSRTAEKWRRHAGRTQIVPLGNKGVDMPGGRKYKESDLSHRKPNRQARTSEGAKNLRTSATCHRIFLLRGRMSQTRRRSEDTWHRALAMPRPRAFEIKETKRCSRLLES